MVHQRNGRVEETKQKVIHAESPPRIAFPSLVAIVGCAVSAFVDRSLLGALLAAALGAGVRVGAWVAGAWRISMDPPSGLRIHMLPFVAHV